MRRARRMVPLLALCLAAAGWIAAEDGSVGSRAEPLQNATWLNCPESTGWGSFAGQAILVERWATW